VQAPARASRVTTGGLRSKSQSAHSPVGVGSTCLALLPPRPPIYSARRRLVWIGARSSAPGLAASLAAPRAAEAQPAGKICRVAIVSWANEILDGLFLGPLRDFGYVEGRNLISCRAPVLREQERTGP
jgi:hypothetical protein